MYSTKLPLTDEQGQGYHLKPIYMGDGREGRVTGESGKPKLTARHDDDDDYARRWKE